MSLPAHIRRGKNYQTTKGKDGSTESRSSLESKIRGELTEGHWPFEYEPIRIKYVPLALERTYVPDFVLANGIVIEAKGYFTSADRQKMKAVKAQYPDLDIRFVFANPRNRLGSKSTTTYGKWAIDHGFPYATVSIPTAWLLEEFNRPSLAVIRSLRK